MVGSPSLGGWGGASPGGTQRTGGAKNRANITPIWNVTNSRSPRHGTPNLRGLPPQEEATQCEMELKVKMKQ